MKEEIGLWIDHKKTVIVNSTGDEIITLNSNMEKHVRFSGGAHGKTAYGAQYFPADDQQDRRFVEHLNKYYSDVIAHLRDAKAIVIMGPGEAKLELEKRLEHAGLKEYILNIETADKLTERQIAARVKQFFAGQKQPVG
ncbi:MAG: hypothetical protein NTW32_06650 [Chloroflexi bacterium]|nr:hypothetical protein [Chloroflexota bacterium]